MRCSLVFVTLLVAKTALADPDDVITRPLVLDHGQVAAALDLEINLAPVRLLAHPVSIAPDVWWGVAPRWTVGLIHSDPSVDRFAPGASFCVVKEDMTVHGGCDRLYRGGGLDVLWSAVAGRFAVAPRARLLLRDVDPAKPAVTLGALARWTRGRFAVTGDPYLQLGLANTDLGNRAELWLPIAFTVQPTCRWAITLRTGWDSDLAEWTDGWHIPVALSVLARATEHVDVSAMVGFTSLLGPQNTAKDRALFLTVGWRS